MGLRKAHDPEAYHPAVMAQDALALLDHLEIGQAAVMGYSMGARISAFLAMPIPSGSRRAFFGAWASISSTGSRRQRHHRWPLGAFALTSLTPLRASSASSPITPGRTARHWRPVWKTPAIPWRVPMSAASSCPYWWRGRGRHDGRASRAVGGTAPRAGEARHHPPSAITCGHGRQGLQGEALAFLHVIYPSGTNS